jgi:hypothetical protein
VNQRSPLRLGIERVLLRVTGFKFKKICSTGAKSIMLKVVANMRNKSLSDSIAISLNYSAATKVEDIHQYVIGRKHNAMNDVLHVGNMNLFLICTHERAKYLFLTGVENIKKKV